MARSTHPKGTTLSPNPSGTNTFMNWRLLVSVWALYLQEGEMDWKHLPRLEPGYETLEDVDWHLCPPLGGE